MSSTPDQKLKQLQHGDHACSMHASAAQQTSSGVIFTRIGLERGERCIYVAEDSTYESVVHAFAAETVDVAEEQRKGALTIFPRSETCLRSGRFAAQEMIDYLAASERDALAAGYSGLRFQSEMTWALDANVPRAQLIEYESSLNSHLQASRTLVACHYLQDRFDAASIQDVLVTHPTVVVSGHPCPNSYYEPADSTPGPDPMALPEFKRKRIGWWVTRLQDVLDSEQGSVKSTAATHEQEELVQCLLDSTDEAIYGIDLEGRCILANPTSARLLGYSTSADLTGQLMHPLIHHHHENGRVYSVGECPIHHTLVTQESVHHGDEVFWRADGTPFNVEYWAHPVWRNDVFRGAVVTFLDISHRKALETQLRMSQKMQEIGRLAGGVAHDFNNMLTVITGYSQLLLNLTPLDDPKRQYIEEIRKAGERSASLTRQLLALNRAEVQSPRELDLNGVIRDMEKMLLRVIGEDVRMNIVLTPDLGHIKADPSQMEQVLLNLMINARDAMPQGGDMRIETDNVVVGDANSELATRLPCGRYVRLSVADCGLGMSEFVKSQLFEPFFTTKVAGNGLGLPVVYDIVTHSEGLIEVESKPGEGTVFQIYFPQVERNASIQAAEDAVGEPTRGSQTILLVEDDDAVRALARFALEGHGYTVLEAGSAREALQICAKTAAPIHLLLTDVVMPETSGRILAEKLGSIYPQMRILFMSGYTDDAVLRHGIFYEQVNFLQKPFSPATLAEKVRSVLDG